MENNTIESLPAAEDLKETPTIADATPTVDKAEEAVSLGDATPELLKEALKDDQLLLHRLLLL